MPDSSSVVRQAQDAFLREDFQAAVDLLKRGLIDTPDNPEVHFYLGYYLHYLCYDSAPLSGYDDSRSDEVLLHLRRAIELDSGLGDAKYFLGSEYGVRARRSLARGDLDGAQAAFRAGRTEGGYPDWLLEYGRNILRTCGPGAILIVGGDADTNPVQYLQIVERLRPDVTVVPYPLLHEPWFVKLLKDGLDQAIRPAALSWTGEQIESMRPYKWRENPVVLPVADSDSTGITWLVKPDLTRDDERTLLSAGRAALVDVIRSNQFRRPVHFSLGCSPTTWTGLESYIALAGPTYTLLPKVAAQPIDRVAIIRFLLDDDSFGDLGSVCDSRMPRAERVLTNYQTLFVQAAFAALQSGDLETARRLLDTHNRVIPDCLEVPAHIKGGLDRVASILAESE